MESHFRITIIGLGIIGGSAAYALKGFNNAEIIGFDTNDDVMRLAVERGAINESAKSVSDAINGSDLIIIATYPNSIPSIVSENKQFFKRGAVLCEFCGVKTKISAEIEAVLPDGVYYVGGHPMAGKEVDGFVNAEPDLYKNCGFIITPSQKSSEESVKMIYDMAEYIGASRIDVCVPKIHDELIAYTSDLMHIAASALCLDFDDRINLAYTAGAFRDCTRVALINPELWTELFMINGNNTVKQIDKYINSLTKLRNAISEKDDKSLFEMLKTVRNNKEDILKREPKRGLCYEDIER